MPLTETALEAVLAADDWPFERAGESTWFSAFQRSSGPGEPITFFLRLTDDWLFLTIAPFAVLPDDPATEANRAAWQTLTRWPRPFLVAFSDGDPITGGMAPILRQEMKGAQGLDHPVIENAGHFLQEDAGVRLGEVVAGFMRRQV